MIFRFLSPFTKRIDESTPSNLRANPWHQLIPVCCSKSPKKYNVCIYIYIIYPNGLAEFCPSKKITEASCGCVVAYPKVPSKKTFAVFIANLHIKLTHHANEDIQYKDLGRLRCFYKKKTRGESRYPSGQVHSKKSDFGGA